MFVIIAAVVVHPTLWPTAVRQAARLVPNRWWTRAPFLPVPSKAYIEFRLLTQYGETSHRPQSHDVVNYLRWCRDWQRFDGHHRSR
jgi:hypothetical protein